MKNKGLIICGIAIVLILVGIIFNVIMSKNTNNPFPDKTPVPTATSTVSPSPNVTPDPTIPPEELIIEEEKLLRYSCTQGVEEKVVESSGILCKAENKYTFTVQKGKIIDNHMTIIYEFSNKSDYEKFIKGSSLEGTNFKRSEDKANLKITDSAFFSLPTTDGSVNNFTEDYIPSIENDGYTCTVLN